MKKENSTITQDFIEKLIECPYNKEFIIVDGHSHKQELYIPIDQAEKILQEFEVALLNSMEFIESEEDKIAIT